MNDDTQAEQATAEQATADLSQSDSAAEPLVAAEPAEELTQPLTEQPTEPLGEQLGEQLVAKDAEEAKEAEAAEEDDISTHRFECRSCGFVYDPGEGVKKLGIEPGTAFLDLDAASFRCPVCRSKVGAFKDIGPRNKPSGFEENLNYGLGVNRLTPGQKNVLIFGGFALAFAFFLSLYSLR